jgi:hypothetical protein
MSNNGPLLCEVSCPAQPVGMCSCTSAETLFAFEPITQLPGTHLQEPSPKRNLGAAPKAATPVDAGTHQQLFNEDATHQLQNIHFEYTTYSKWL